MCFSILSAFPLTPPHLFATSTTFKIFLLFFQMFVSILRLLPNLIPGDIDIRTESTKTMHEQQIEDGMKILSNIKCHILSCTYVASGGN